MSTFEFRFFSKQAAEVKMKNPVRMVMLTRMFPLGPRYDVTKRALLNYNMQDGVGLHFVASFVAVRYFFPRSFRSSSFRRVLKLHIFICFRALWEPVRSSFSTSSKKID